MKTRNRFALLLAVILLTNASGALAQKRAKAKRVAADSTAETVEPLRVINGELSGRTVAGEFSANGRTAGFTFTFARAEIAGGRLQLGGAFSVDNQLSQALTARLVGVMAKAANPWPSAREEKPKDKSKAPVTEQTQSLYVQADAATDCGALFLRMELPPRLRAAMGAGSEPMQMGIVLAPINNRKGEEVNHSICQVYKSLSNKAAGGNLSASLEALNRLLAASR
jgi:hypothetical protein